VDTGNFLQLCARARLCVREAITVCASRLGFCDHFDTGTLPWCSICGVFRILSSVEVRFTSKNVGTWRANAPVLERLGAR
jgi:hypothetical protein